jgi:membrane-associated HD superfamily phosphohydrolase
MQKPGERNKKKDGRHVRSKYMDPSQSFVDWVNTVDLEKSHLGRMALFLEKHLELRRFGILFIYSMFLAFLLNFDVDFVYSVQVGEISGSDIKSPISFDIEDAIATEEKRVTAAKSIPPVFDFDPRIYDHLTDNVYRAFRFMREKRRGYIWGNDNVRRDEVIKELLTY